MGEGPISRYKDIDRLAQYIEAGWGDYFVPTPPGRTDCFQFGARTIPFYREAVLQFRLETYNTFNHPEFNALNNTATFANANSSSNAETDATFGQLTGALNPRLVQLALRINF